jgi:hypothetical protein
MGLSNWLTLGCLVTGLIQASDCILRWTDRGVVGGSDNPGNLSRRRSMSIVLGIGAVICPGLAAWLFFGHPLKSQIVTVEKPCSLTQQQTGDATTKGNQSPANSGNQNSTTYGTPAPPPAKQGH